MTVDLDAMRKLAAHFFLQDVVKHYGEDGRNALREVFQHLSELFTYIDPEQITGRLFVFKNLTVKGSAGEFAAQASAQDRIEAISISSLAQSYTTEMRCGDVVVQLCDDGHFEISEVTDADLRKLADSGIVYEYSQRKDYVWCKDKRDLIPNPFGTTHASTFAIPTFRTLREALEGYKVQMVRQSSCQLLSEAWENGPSCKRLFFRSAPEHLMRDSLTQFLKSTLRDVAEIRPEQVVDTSHPVDVKVTWGLGHKLALIEIKWLGKSRSEKGTIS